MKFLLFLIFTYLYGSIPFGLLFSKLKGKDPRLSGSKNIGATNVLRTVGKGFGLLTLLADTSKGFLPLFFASEMGYGEISLFLFGLAAFFGHIFPLYLSFKGGKGVACALGIFLALSPLYTLFSILFFLFLLLLFRYVSLASLSSSWFMVFLLYFFGEKDPFLVLCLIIAIFITLRHKENIRRLFEGKEHKLFLKGGG